ncbi:hypothetical protein E1263_12985 [Kribbella antibiotica]|uniref:Uncharacterized protein n=1 Tax=Kribbella antibiotica TaxID=190195 RepID=A0A4R4ZN23_9ACTN|nr:hypothetical protein [Kribbella antibiotica]TDD60005.1 hypothetical protein E1263_12985 [Kribbella antibiotica]
MPETDNSAGRLLTIFSRYRASYSPTGGLLQLWGTTLGADDEAETRRRAASVVDLLRQVRWQLEDLEEAAYVEMYDVIAPDLLRTLMLTRDASTQMGQGPSVEVPVEHLTSLKVLSTVLRSSGVVNVRVSDGVRADLRSRILEALDAARNDQDLGPRVRAAVVARLHDILRALDLIDTIGPEDALAAAERLGFVYHAVEEKSSGIVKAWKAARLTFRVFLVGGDTLQAIEAVKDVPELLP